MAKTSSKKKQTEKEMRKFKVGDNVLVSNLITSTLKRDGTLNFTISDFEDGLYTIRPLFRVSEVSQYVFKVPHYFLCYESNIKEKNIIDKIKKHNEINDKKLSFYGELVPPDKLGSFKKQYFDPHATGVDRIINVLFYFNTDHFFVFDDMLIPVTDYLNQNYQVEKITGLTLPQFLLTNFVKEFNYETGEAVLECLYNSRNKSDSIPFITRDEIAYPFNFYNEETAIKNGFIYQKNTEFFFHKTYKGFNKWRVKGHQTFRNYFNDTNKVNTFLIPSGLSYTFGVEIETNTGMVPYFKAANLNMSCVRDGSCGNGGSGEYVTGILKGDNGFFQLKDICDTVGFNCTVDNTCGLHVHIGNVKFTKEFNIAMYKMGLMIQDEIFSMFPLSRLKTRNRYYIDGHGSNAGRTHGSSCGKLPDLGIFTVNNITKLPKESMRIEILEMYKKLYSWLATNDINAVKKLTKKTSVLFGHQNRYPLARYVWLNMIPTNFSRNGTKEGLTVEFRNHPGTINYFKIKNWVLICMAIVNYVENNAYSVLEKETITLDEILRYSYSKRKLESLLDYIEKRKTMYNVSDPSINAEIEDREYASDTVNQNEKITKKQLILE